MEASEGEIPIEKPFSQRLQSLLRVDCIRASRILETCQYAALYTLMCLPVGILIDSLFARMYPKVSEEGKGLTRGEAWWAVLTCTLQVMLDAVVIFYIRKVANLFPFMLDFLCYDKYVPHYKVAEIFGEAAMALIFVGCQTSLIDTLARLRKYFSPGG